MKAAIRDKYGPPDVVEVRDVERPTPKDDEILVRVRAASVNRADLDYLGPRPGFLRPMIGMRAPRDPRTGIDVAGEVESVGTSVTRFRPGDPVFADVFSFGQGAFAEYVCAPEKAFLPMPAGLSFEDAATLPHSAILALQGLRRRNGRTVQPGDKVLIDGASGNVGPFAVQIAKSYGAEVTGVASPAKLEFVRSLGADHVLDYTAVDYTRASRALRLDPRHRFPPSDPPGPARPSTERHLPDAWRHGLADHPGDHPGPARLAGQRSVVGNDALVEAVQPARRHDPDRHGRRGHRSSPSSIGASR